MSLSTAPAFADLLHQAVTVPGILSKAYQQFHNYSLGNVLLAWGQCHAREIPLGPMATYPKWKELGRHVKRGETAITLCQPVTIKKKGADAGQEEEFLLRFTYRNRWFVLAQTEGADLPPADPPGWDKARALAALDVVEVPFDIIDGNIMGYARDRQVAISPINPCPFKTLFHELAHVLLGHTAESAQADSETTPQSLRECEAESVALLCCEALGLPGAAESRGYIQHWYGQGNPIPERSAQRILRVADQILRAGRGDSVNESAESVESGGGQ
jgi:antirestriction protein ArdC